MEKKLYEVKFEELGCQCSVDDLGSILAWNGDCKYHNWLDEMLQDDEDIDRLVTCGVSSQ
jgi:hypothetical protein